MQSKTIVGCKALGEPYGDKICISIMKGHTTSKAIILLTDGRNQVAGRFTRMKLCEIGAACFEIVDELEKEKDDGKN